MTKVLITGGAGLIGSHIIDQLARDYGFDRDGEIVVVDNLIRGTRENLTQAFSKAKNLKLVVGDIRDRTLMAELMEGVDTLYHMAALRIIHCAAEPRLAMEVMADATFDIFSLAVEKKVRRTVFASSASVYGLAGTFPTLEDHHPYGNRTLYGAAKTFGEGLLRSFNEMYGLSYAALRYFNVYGPRMDIHGAYTEVLIRWMERIVDGKPPLIFGDGKTTMDFVHIDDVARATVLAAEADVTDEVFNVASGTETSLLELAEVLLKVMGSDLTPEFGPERKVNPVPRRLAGTQKAKQLLGFTARVGLEEGMAGLVAWWKAQKGIA